MMSVQFVQLELSSMDYLRIMRYRIFFFFDFLFFCFVGEYWALLALSLSRLKTRRMQSTIPQSLLPIFHENMRSLSSLIPIFCRTWIYSSTYWILMVWWSWVRTWKFLQIAFLISWQPRYQIDYFYSSVQYFQQRLNQ